MAKTSKQTKAHNLIDMSLKAVFLTHTAAFERADGKVKAAAKIMAQVKKAAKTDGFTVPQIKFAIQCQTPEGEAIAKSLIANNLLAAAYVDADIGTQFTLFLEPDRTPATERAAKEGATAAMKNEAHAPPYDASVPQYKAWSDAFYAEQERQVKAGISKLDAKAAKANKAPKGKVAKPKGKRGLPAKAKGPNADPPAGSTRTLITKAEKDARAAALAQARAREAKDAAPPRKPVAAPATRGSVKAAREAAVAEADSYFTKAEPQGNA